MVTVSARVRIFAASLVTVEEVVTVSFRIFIMPLTLVTVATIVTDSLRVLNLAKSLDGVAVVRVRVSAFMRVFAASLVRVDAIVTVSDKDLDTERATVLVTESDMVIV